MTGVVRRATAADRGQVVDTVADAFADDPAWRYLHGDDYPRLAPAFAGALFDSRVGSGTVWVTDDVSAVAMCDGPIDASVGSPHQDLWHDYRGFAGEPAWQRLEEYEAALATLAPASPHWYLGVLATRPEHQGRGLASALLARVAERSDADRLPCFLETSSAANRAFYEMRGFAVAAPVPWATGPVTWWMQRAWSGGVG